MPRTLLNRDLLQYQNTVVICESEKDATTITTLWPDKVVGTTSGGANTWDNRFIKFLEGKRCIVMTDADEDGQKYQANIVASLDAANIEYRVVSIGDLGCKDVTEYVEKHSARSLSLPCQAFETCEFQLFVEGTSGRPEHSLVPGTPRNITGKRLATGAVRRKEPGRSVRLDGLVHQLGRFQSII
jgi:DNA primase